MFSSTVIRAPGRLQRALAVWASTLCLMVGCSSMRVLTSASTSSGGLQSATSTDTAAGSLTSATTAPATNGSTTTTSATTNSTDPTSTVTPPTTDGPPAPVDIPCSWFICSTPHDGRSIQTTAGTSDNLFQVSQADKAAAESDRSIRAQTTFQFVIVTGSSDLSTPSVVITTPSDRRVIDTIARNVDDPDYLTWIVDTVTNGDLYVEQGDYTFKICTFEPAKTAPTTVPPQPSTSDYYTETVATLAPANLLPPGGACDSSALGMTVTSGSFTVLPPQPFAQLSTQDLAAGAILTIELSHFDPNSSVDFWIYDSTGEPPSAVYHRTDSVLSAQTDGDGQGRLSWTQAGPPGNYALWMDTPQCSRGCLPFKVS